MVAVTLAFVLGIVLARGCPEYNFSGSVAGVLILIAAAGLSLYRNRLTAAWILGMVSVVLCGLLTALSHRDDFPENDVRALLIDGSFTINEPLAFDGCVLEESELRDSDSVTTIEFHGIRNGDRWRAAQGRGILSVGLSGTALNENESAETTSIQPLLARGDRVRGWATWRRPRNYENPGADDRVARLARRGIFVTGHAKSFQLIETIPGDCAGVADHFANAVRGRVHAGLDHIHEEKDGQRKAILASLIIGDYTGLESTTREAFQNTGTFHVLVVSGMHVAWIAGLLFLIFKRLFIPERICYFLAALAVFAYTGVVGFQASITRCLWVFILLLVGRLFFRRADAMNILFAAALILLGWNPDWLYETGFQLSFLSVAAIILTALPIIENGLKPLIEPLRHCGDATRVFTQPGRAHRLGRRIRTYCELFAEGLSDRFRPQAFPRLCWMLRQLGGATLAIGIMVVTSVAVQLWIEPLLAYGFNRLSWAAPLANIVIVPLSSVTLAVGIAGAVIALTGIGMIMHFAGWLAALLLAAAEAIAQIPGAWQRCPTPSGIWVLAGIILLLIWGLFRFRRRWIPCLYTGLLLACLASGTVPLPDFLRGAKSPWPRDAHILSLTFLDVGQGDAIVIRFPNGLIRTLDAGGLYNFQAEEERSSGFDIGEAVVSRYLWHEWTSRLDRVAISHTDFDHAGGVPALMKNFKVTRFDYTPVGASPAMLKKLLDLARERKIPTHLLAAKMVETAGPVIIRTLHPAMDSELKDGNANSLVLHLKYDRFSALFTGDLEKTGESAILQSTGDLQGLLLKVAHHGSRTATSDIFLKKTNPRWAAISVGRNNPYRHPSPDVLARLKNHSVRTFTTMDHGAITCETDGMRYVIRSHIDGIMEEGTL